MITEEQHKQILREIGWSDFAIDYLWEGRPEGIENIVTPEATKAVGQLFFDSGKKWAIRQNND